MVTIVIFDIFTFSAALVCLFVCYEHYLKSYEQIAMKFYGGVWGGKGNKWLNFGGDADHHADCPIGNLAIAQEIMNGF